MNLMYEKKRKGWRKGEKVEADVLHVDMGEGREGKSILGLNLHMKKAENATHLCHSPDPPYSCLNGKKLHKKRYPLKIILDWNKFETPATS